MGHQYNKAKTLKEIDRANRECKNGVSGKPSVMDAYIHGLSFDNNISTDVENGTMKLRPGMKVQIFRPKRREAIAPYYRDRVWQRSMCNNGLYDDLTRSAIYDNMACQKGKGNDLAIRRMIGFVQKLYRSDPAAPIYVKHLDERRYFPSTPHEIVKAHDRKKITEPMYLRYTDEIVDSVKDPRPQEEIDADPFGPRGTGLGSQINQLNQVSLPDELDHEIKCFCKYYIRYNDDIWIVDHDKAKVERAAKLVTGFFEGRGIETVDKSGTIVLQKCGMDFLRKKIILTKTGKIIIRLHKTAMQEERKTLKGMKRLLDRGKIGMKNIRQHYQSWIAMAEYAGDGPIRAMDKFYTETFRERPKYKRKRRYLYGKPVQNRKATPPGSGEGESKAESGERKTGGDA